MPPNKRLRISTGLETPRSLGTTRVRRDPFRRPTEGQDLQKIARGLAEFNEALGSAASGFLERRQEEQSLKGQQAFQELEEDQKTYRELVRSGDLPAGANPHYQAAFQTEAGKSSANRFRSFFIAKVDEELSGSTSLADFDQVADEALEEFIEKNVGQDNRTEAFNIGFNSRVQAYIDNQRSQFAAEITPRLQAKETRVFGANVFDDVLREYSDGTDPEAIGQGLTGILDEKAQIDPSNTTGRADAVVDAVVDAAVARQDASILDILKHVKGGRPGQERRPTLGSTNRARDAIQKARENIAILNSRERRAAQARAERERDAAVRSVWNTAIQRLQEASDHQDADLSDLEGRLGEVGAGNMVTKLHSIQDNFVDQTFTDNESVVQFAYSRIWTREKGDPLYFEEDDAHNLLASGQITPSTHGQIMEVLQDRRESQVGGSSLIEARDMLSDGTQAIDDKFRNQFGAFQSTQLQTRADRAKTWYLANFGQWLRSEEGQEANDSEVLAQRVAFTEQAFRIFATGTSRAQDVEEVPDPDIGVPGASGPRPIDWNSAPMTDSREDIVQLQQEVLEKSNNQRNRLSPQSQAILEAAGRPPIMEFINAQLQIWDNIESADLNLNAFQR